MPAALRNVGFEPPLNGQMPLDLAFRDETGRDCSAPRIFRAKARGSRVRLLRLPDALQSGRTGRRRRAADALLQSRPRLRSCFRQLRFPRNSGHGRRKEEEWRWLISAARKPIPAGISSPARKNPSTPSPKPRIFVSTFDAKTNLFAHASGIMLLTPGWPHLPLFLWRRISRPRHPPRTRGCLRGQNRHAHRSRSCFFAISTIRRPPRYSASILKIIRLGGVLTILCLVARNLDFPPPRNAGARICASRLPSGLERGAH